MVEDIKINIHTVKTKLSGVIDIEELVKYAENERIKTIGISDYNSVRGFPELYRLTKKNNQLKVIYGAELLVRYAGVFKVKVIVKNNIGLKNLYQIISMVNDTKGDRNGEILRSELKKQREGLLIGASGLDGELFFENKQLSIEEIENKMSWYDYIIINPPKNVKKMVGREKVFRNIEEYYEYTRNIIEVAKKNNKMVVGLEEIYALNKKDVLARKILMDKLKNREEYINSGNKKIKTREKLNQDFVYLGKEIAKEIVVDNLEKINAQTENIEILKEQMVSPRIKKDEKELITKINKKIEEIYGEKIAEEIFERVEEELVQILEFGSATNYLIVSELVDRSKNKGYIVGDRGGVGGVLVAKLLGITGTNPLPPHYICKKCKTHIFEVDSVRLEEKYISGYDMEEIKCPSCSCSMNGEGQNIIFNKNINDKIMLDFNIAEKYKITEYIKEIIKKDNVYFAGVENVIGEVKAKKDVAKYLNKKNINMEEKELAELIKKYSKINEKVQQLDSSKAVIVPKSSVAEELLPIDTNKFGNKSTHYKYIDMASQLFSIEGLSHIEQDMLQIIKDMINIDVEKIPWNDKEIYSLFEENKNSRLIGIKCFENIKMEEFLKHISIEKFSDLVQIVGLIFGRVNIKDVLGKEKINLNKIIITHEDMYNYLKKFKLDYKEIKKIMQLTVSGKIRRKFRTKEIL